LSVDQEVLRELSLDEIFTRTFKLYSQHFAQFLLPFIIAGALQGAVLVELESAITVPAVLSATASLQELLNWLWGFLSAVLTIAFLSGIVGWIIGSITQGIAVKFTSDTVENREPTLMSSFSFTLSRLLPLLVVSIITSILIAIGLLALIIPGIILAIMFSLVVPVIIIEHAGALESLSRSRVLVHRRWLKTFGVLFLFQILIGIMGSVIGVLTDSLGLVGPVASSILLAFIQPILPIGLTLYYYSMTARETQAAGVQPAQTV
jgi:hypothetical protein